VTKLIACAALTAACLLSTPLAAQTYFFSGQVGNAPVFASLSRDGNQLTGWYLYARQEKDIELQGTIDASGKFHLDESSFDTTRNTGSFAGRVDRGVWSGTWRNATGGAAAPFSLTENHDTLAKLSGDFRCSEKHRDRKYGYDYSRSARVTFVKGAITRLDLAQTSQGKDGDSQGCYIGLDDFKRVPSGAGVLLRAKADKPGADTQHCTVHIVADSKFVFIAPGDLSENGNDCKGADDDVMFCSPRANWGDFLIDTSGVCKPKN
jgi:hypothetical protein